MKTFFKKTLSVLLCVIMLFSLAIPTLAATANYSPVVLIRGDGGALSKIDENGEETLIYPVETEGMSGKIGETAVNILIPFLTEGLLFDKWDNYYDVVYEEISPIFKDVILDNNGNPRDNSGITSNLSHENKVSVTDNTINWRGYYKATDYTYQYDWRLDPEDVIDGLHDYIVKVYNRTGRKVTLAGLCLGGSYVLAYLQKYCMNGSKYVKNVFFDATVGNGSVVLTDVYCGKIEVNDKSLQRFTDTYVDADSSSLGGLIDTTPFINEIVLNSVDLLVQLGLLEKLGLTVDEVYQKVYEKLVPMLVLAFYGTMPGYWTVIETERFEEAKNFVFGKKGSEYRTEYAGLIEKLDNYYNKVSTKKTEIINACKEAGIHFGATAKYGVQMSPFVESQTKLSDELVDFHHASFGATTASSVYSTFSNQYIESAKAKGTEKYISLDKQVDASTSIFKNTLWVQKNVPHDTWIYDYKLIEKFSQTPNMTVSTDPNFPQYVILLPDSVPTNEETGKKDFSQGKIVPMTEENCNFILWSEIHEDTKEESPTVVTKLMAFFRWLTSIFKYLTSLLK